MRFGKNKGITNLSGGTTANNYDQPSGSRHFVKVSAFLTGRNYSGPSGSATFQDDFVDPTDDAMDATMDGLYYVYDPTNDGSNTYPGPQPPHWGYNDLERRKKDLCMLVNSQCDNSVAITLKLVKNVSFAAVKE